MKKVLLITMPFSSVRCPAIGISLLKSGLGQRGIACDIGYYNLMFAGLVGLDSYEEICSSGFSTAIGERLFAKEFFKGKLPGEDEYLAAIAERHPITIDYFQQVSALSEYVQPFMNRVIESVNWEEYDIVGFSVMFEQNIASLFLAQAIKTRDPSKIIVFGGANCEGTMGWQLHRCFDCIDYICAGEADDSFPMLVQRCRAGRPVGDIPGVIYRKNGQSIATALSSPIANLDALPYPDYKDYFAQLERNSLPISTCQSLPWETSRGCWWGEKSQCSFCGLNGAHNAFRGKSFARILDELDYLLDRYVRRYRLSLISTVDNILDMKYFKKLIPALAAHAPGINFFFETKSNLTREQVAQLSLARVTWIQPGIESLNSHTLRLMRKGVTGIQNVQLLKHCRESGIIPSWNILHGFPGERQVDHDQVLNWIYTKLSHLPPPDASAAFTLQRFSPLFQDPAGNGLVNVRPHVFYRFVYPFDEETLRGLAYNFEFDYRQEATPPHGEQAISQAIEFWHACYSSGAALTAREWTPGELLIEDQRPHAVVPWMVLKSLDKEVYDFCDSVRGFASILRHLRETYRDYAVRERDVRDFLQEMTTLNLMVAEQDHYLSLALTQKGNHWAA